jgi:hypothetical protein
VQCPVEAALDRSLVAGDLGKSLRAVRVADEGSPQRGGFRFSLCVHLPGFEEGPLVLLLVRYRGSREGPRRKEILVPAFLLRIAAGLLASSPRQLPVELPGENAGLDPAKATEPPVGGNDPIDEKVLEPSDGLQLIF